MKLSPHLMLILTPLYLMAGSARSEIEATQDPKFCQLYQKRMFTPQEIEWQSADASWNLRRDIINNKGFDDECAGGGTT